MFYDYKEVSPERAIEIIETCKPLGRFYYKGSDQEFVGVDNSSGNAWVEVFETLEMCLSWLYGDFQMSDIEEGNVSHCCDCGRYFQNDVFGDMYTNEYSTDGDSGRVEEFDRMIRHGKVFCPYCYQKRIKTLWEELEDVPFDSEKEVIEVDWYGFGAGTGKEDIWHWFDKMYDGGIASLLGLLQAR